MHSCCRAITRKAQYNAVLPCCRAIYNFLLCRQKAIQKACIVFSWYNNPALDNPRYFTGTIHYQGTSYAAADTYSARPGHSEHQTGLAADIKGPNNNLYLDQRWINTSEGQWLNNNCYKYGFIIRYPSGKESITGYIYEPWHIRYVGTEVATQLYNGGNWITLEEYLGIDSKY